MTLQLLKKELIAQGNPTYAAHHQRFFKTNPGGYGEGDKFIGVKIPIIRKTAKTYQSLTTSQIEKLLQSPIHEFRLCALIIAIKKSKDEDYKRWGFNLFKKNLKKINNWDLIDISTPHLVGRYLENQKRDILYTWARSNHLWTKRASIIATFHFIRCHDFSDCLKISQILLKDENDLIHKAVGWMLREVGKRDQKAEERFLKKYYSKMPRTMLRYAIEKFPERKRQAYLKGKI